jgi:hypothetical protein
MLTHHALEMRKRRTSSINARWGKLIEHWYHRLGALRMSEYSITTVN